CGALSRDGDRRTGCHHRPGQTSGRHLQEGSTRILGRHLGFSPLVWTLKIWWPRAVLVRGLFASCSCSFSFSFSLAEEEKASRNKSAISMMQFFGPAAGKVWGTQSIVIPLCKKGKIGAAGGLLY